MRLLIVILLLLSVPAYGQKTILEITFSSNADVKFKKEHKDTHSAERELNKVFQLLYNKGYLAAYTSNSIKENGKWKIEIETGNIFTSGIIRKGNAEEKMLSSIGFREKIYRNKLFSADLMSQLADKILRYYENNGYPFAAVRLDSISIHDNQISAALLIEKNNLYKVDSIIIKGGSKIKKNYIENYVGISEGDVYNEEAIMQIDQRLKELPFLLPLKPVEVIFTKNKCMVYIYADAKKASQFNGVVGILPDNITGKITITGDVRIRLKNTLNSGELFDLNWRKLNTNIQDMRLQLNYPFLFKTSFGFDGLFKLYKKDSTFIELNESAGIQYMLKGGNFMKISFTNQSTSLITPSMFSSATVLPEFADVQSLLYGIGTRIEKLDYRLNPRSGFAVDADLKAGTKKIKKNTALNETIYEGITLNTSKYHLNLTAECYLPLIKHTTLKIGSANGWIENENLFLNELYRLGGIRNLRGFNEESIFASFYTVNTIEFRYLLEQNSNIYVFFDHCYYERKLMNSFFHDMPYGFGAGISFQTKAGIFSMNYALGSEQHNPIFVRNAKIHFGFVNYF